MLFDDDDPFSEEERELVEDNKNSKSDELILNEAVDDDKEDNGEDEQESEPDDEDLAASDGDSFINDDEIEDDIDDEEMAESPPNDEEQAAGDEIVDEDQEAAPKVKRVKSKDKRKKLMKEFIDDEAELSDDGEFSDDEVEDSGDDEKIDTDLVDLEAKDLDSDEEEDVRRLYHKQIESEDRRALLLLQEQLDENQIVGQQRRRKFRWQTKAMMENSLRRHYDPDDEDSQDTDGDDDDIDYSDFEPRLKRPTAETLLLGASRLMQAPSGNYSDDESSIEAPRTYSKSNRYADPAAGPSSILSDDSNSNLISSRLAHGPTRVVTTKQNVDMNKFLFRDKELVAALSTKETIIATREEKDQAIQRELKRVLQSKSIFDQLYS